MHPRLCYGEAAGQRYTTRALAKRLFPRRKHELLVSVGDADKRTWREPRRWNVPAPKGVRRALLMLETCYLLTTDPVERENPLKKKNHTIQELKLIGQWERKLMWSCVAMIIGNLIVRMADPIFDLVVLPVVIFAIYCLYRFAFAVQLGWVKWILMVLALLPLIGLISIVILVTRVNKFFKERGIPIGLMGPDLSKIPE